MPIRCRRPQPGRLETDRLSWRFAARYAPLRFWRLRCLEQRPPLTSWLDGAWDRALAGLYATAPDRPRGQGQGTLGPSIRFVGVDLAWLPPPGRSASWA